MTERRPRTGTWKKDVAPGFPKSVTNAPKRRQLSVRRTQTVAPFGVGAIYDVLGESFVAADILEWGMAGDRIDLDRLARKMGVDHFRTAPASSDLGAAGGPGIPYFRFPEWLFCATCRRMSRYRYKDADQTPVCDHCPRRPRLVPVRFVMACRKGHLADVDWWRWAHSIRKGLDQKNCQQSDLRWMTVSGAGGGLAAVLVECRGCGAGRTLQGIVGVGILKTVGISCPGRQPWESVASGCDETPIVLQRGANNLHYAHVESALDIPPGSNFAVDRDLRARVMNHPVFPALVTSNIDNPFADGFILQIVNDAATTESLVRTMVNEEKKKLGMSVVEVTAESSLEVGEWMAFRTPRPDQDERDGFVVDRVPVRDVEGRLEVAVADELERIVDSVVIARRLREVRALEGFSRIEPGGPDSTMLRPALGAPVPWAPAVEVYGEGIFLSLDERRVASWESAVPPGLVAELSSRLDQTSYRHWLPAPTLRLLLLHTLSHLLMRRLTFECGYSSSSLRERIYASQPGAAQPMCGLLIYTAAGDAEGSLGGLARQGEPPRLARTIVAALRDSLWCSADPICQETRSGPNGLNRAACHACSLVSETSCTMSNVLLDRSLLIGTTDFPGYFQPLLDAAMTVVN